MEPPSISYKLSLGLQNRLCLWYLWCLWPNLVASECFSLPLTPKYTYLGTKTMQGKEHFFERHYYLMSSEWQEKILYSWSKIRKLYKGTFREQQWQKALRIKQQSKKDLQSSQRKRTPERKKTIRLTADFSTVIVETRRQRHNIL